MKGENRKYDWIMIILQFCIFLKIQHHQKHKAQTKIFWDFYIYILPYNASKIIPAATS